MLRNMVKSDHIITRLFSKQHRSCTGPPRDIFGPRGKRKLGPPPPVLQIMILKLSPPRCVIHVIISKESVQQKWIDELWFRKQLSTCLFVWTLNYKSWAPGQCPGWSPLSGSDHVHLVYMSAYFLNRLKIKHYVQI